MLEYKVHAQQMNFKIVSIHYINTLILPGISNKDT